MFYYSFFRVFFSFFLEFHFSFSLLWLIHSFPICLFLLKIHFEFLVLENDTVPLNNSQSASSSSSFFLFRWGICCCCCCCSVCLSVFFSFCLSVCFSLFLSLSLSLSHSLTLYFPARTIFARLRDTNSQQDIKTSGTRSRRLKICKYCSMATRYDKPRQPNKNK